ncbi:MAG: hypothetical protein JW881_04640 [Spirochaetales bacterium]|nr:hypothetical protein [Spirochaetales bacterium]
MNLVEIAKAVLMAVPLVLTFAFSVKMKKVHIPRLFMGRVKVAEIKHVFSVKHLLVQIAVFIAYFAFVFRKIDILVLPAMAAALLLSFWFGIIETYVYASFYRVQMGIRKPGFFSKIIAGNKTALLKVTGNDYVLYFFSFFTGFSTSLISFYFFIR